MEPDGVEEGLGTGHSSERELPALQEIIALMQGTSNLKEALEQVSKAIVDVLGYDNLILGLMDRDKNVIKPAVTHTKLGEGLVARLEGIIGQRFIDFEMPVERDYSEAARKLLDGEVFVTHSLSDILSPPVRKLVCYAMQQQAKARTMANVPLLGKEGVIGAILVTTPQEDMTNAELQTLATFANQAGIAVEHAWLQHEIAKEAEEKRKVEQKVIEEAAKLRESRAYIESMFSAIADPIAVVNTDKVIVAVNKAMTELLGYAEDELIGHNYIDIYIPPERRQLSGTATEEILAEGVTLTFERIWQTKGGEEIPVAITDAPLRDDKGKIIGAIGVARDMRQLKSLIGELERSKAYIESVFSAIADPIMVFNPERSVTAVNKAMTGLLGYGEDELVGHDYIDVIIPPDRRHLSGRTTEEVVARGVTLFFERIWQTKGGEEIPVAIHEAPLRDDRGDIVGVVAIARDTRQTRSLIAELERSKAFIEGVFSTIADPIVVVNPDQVIIAVNNALTELFGYGEDELLGRNFVDVMIPPGRRHLAGEAQRKVVTNGTTSMHETIWQAKDSEEIPVAIHIAPLRDDQDNIIGAIAAARDMRHVNSLISELERSKAYIETIFSTIADPIMVVNPDLIIIAVNKAMTELFGYAEGELVGHNYIDVIIPPDRRDLSGITHSDVVTKGVTLVVERTWQTRNGAEIPLALHLAPLRDDQGNVIGTITAARDMRQIKSLISELERSKAFIESVFSTIADPIVVVNADRVIIAVNRAMTELSGYSENELIGHTYFDVLHPPHERHLSGRRHSEVVDQGVTHIFERVWQTKDGAEIPVAIHDAPLRDDRGDIIGVIGAARDMREWKSLIAELERRKAFIESVFSTIADPVVVIDLDEVIIATNKAITELLGFSEDELIGHNYIDVIIPPERRHLSGQTIGEVITEGVPLVYERVWQARGGEEIPVALHIAPLHDDKGDIIGTIAAARDMREWKSLIAELEQSSEELARSEQKYRDLVENINDGYFVIQEGKLVFVNRRAAEILGYEVEEAIGEPFARFVAPERLSELQERYKKRMRGEAVSPQYETMVLTKDGTRVPVELSMTVAPYQDKLADHGVLRDISERKRLEREKSEAWERYRAIFDNAPDAIIVTDANNIVQFWNRRAEEHSGYKADEIVGMSAEIFVPPELSEEARRLRREVRKKGYIQGYETERMMKDGSRVPQELTIAALKDENGQVVGFTTIARDISERKRLEQEKAEAQERLIRAERLASIGQVASSVAHELRQPLSVINNSAYFIGLQLPDAAEKVKKHLSILEREVATADRIISDLLDSAKPVKLRLEPADLNSVVEQALSRAQLPQGVEVTTDLRELPQVMADTEALERVFLNIILNAAQAMPNGGRVLINSDVEDSSVMVKFQDGGSGIAEEDLSKIFEPMFTTKARGVGLGLTICKSIVEALQGTIDIQSQLGHGTTVTIKLPTTSGDEHD